MLIYIILIPLLWGASKAASARNKFGYLMAAVVLLTLVAGFRAEDVGIDTPSYISKIEYISEGHPELAYGLESGFVFLIQCTLKINDSITFVFVVIAFFTNFLIIRRLWDFKNIASVPCMVLCYYAAFYGFTLNIMRQFLAIAIIFYFSKLLEKRQYFRFLLVVILSAVFLHRSSLICVVFIAADILLWKDLSKRQRRIIMLGIAAFIFALPAAYSLLVGSEYAKYFAIQTKNLGFMVPAKIAFFAISLYSCKARLFPRNANRVSEEGFREYRGKKGAVIYYPVGLTISLLGYFFAFMERIGFYFLIFECVYFGMLTKMPAGGADTYQEQTIARNNRLIYTMLTILLVGYCFAVYLLGNGQGTVPYHFV